MRIESEKLMIMGEFLKNLGLDFEIRDEKLYLLNIKDKHCEILEKCDELGITYTQERKPVYGATDPFTLSTPIVGFIRNDWLEVKND